MNLLHFCMFEQGSNHASCLLASDASTCSFSARHFWRRRDALVALMSHQCILACVFSHFHEIDTHIELKVCNGHLPRAFALRRISAEPLQACRSTKIGLNQFEINIPVRSMRSMLLAGYFAWTWTQRAETLVRIPNASLQCWFCRVFWKVRMFSSPSKVCRAYLLPVIEP